MRCPRCETSELFERDREGVTIDVCQDCRGVWLDRGELEKIIARTQDDFDSYADSGRRSFGRREERPEPSRYESRRDDRGDRGRKPRKKEGFIDTLGDLFDFG